MTVLRLKYIHSFRDRHGKARLYFRHKGRRCALPGEVGSEEFMRRYAECMAKFVTVSERRAAPPMIRGSIRELCVSYLRSPAFTSLASATQRQYRGIIEAFCQLHSDKPVSCMERRHIIRWQEHLADTPGAANSFIRVLSVLLSYAVDSGMRKDNPAQGVRLYRTGEFRAWSDDEIEQFRKRWHTETMQRRGLELALYTGQRRADLVRMTRADLDGDFIRVVQSKTGARLSIRLHHRLRHVLSIGPSGHLSLLVTTAGKAFDPVYFGGWFKKAIRATSLPEECQLHGLRKTAAKMLAEAGCTELEIMAITGHTTSRMISKYTKDADQRIRASAAILKLEKNKL